MRIEHVNLTVSDLSRSVDFYCRLFDFCVRWQDTDSADQPGPHIGNDDLYIAFFEAPEAGAADSDYDRVGLNHFGLVVDDLALYRERLSGLGVTPHHEADYAPGQRLYFFDPDGIEVELVAYPPDSTDS